MYVTFVVSGCALKGSSQRTTTNRAENHPRKGVTTVNGGLMVQRYEYFSYLSIVCLCFIVFYCVLLI